VLDIGCGTGRTAIPLMQYLDEGTYDGLDISAAAVGWCHRTLTPRNPKFRFSVVDAANAHYNPRGTIDAAQLTFPYADDAFDFAIATSLFTHLLPAEFGNYVGEAARVLGGGGMLFATFFLLRDESLEALTRGASQLVLSASLHDSRVGVDFLAASRGSPETAVALPETFVRVSLERAGFEAVAVHPGNWADSRRGKFFQDIVICRRCAATR
jgi:SAM-dependent methyltransferase